MKTCRRCKVEKPEEEFNRDRSSKDGRQGWCRECFRVYYATPVARAAFIRNNHGVPRALASFWAAVLLDPDTTCACCGLSNREITVLQREGPWWPFMGVRSGPAASRTLELGHIVAGDNTAGFVPMCRSCNYKLGIRSFSQENCARVLKARHRELDRTFPKAGSLYWLHTSVNALGFGEGGRLNRSPGTARRDEQFKGGRAD